MALVTQELEACETRAAAQRAALILTVAEISRRLQPRHLMDAATRMAKDKSTELFGEVSNSIKEHGGQAALLGLGAVAAFEVGRKSAEAPRTWKDSLGATQRPAWTYRPNQAIPAAARAGAFARLVAGASLGAVLGGAIKMTASEKALLARVAPDLRKSALAFVEEHSQGAKLLAADAFGFARSAAAFLAVMAVVGDWFAANDTSVRAYNTLEGAS